METTTEIGLDNASAAAASSSQQVPAEPDVDKEPVEKGTMSPLTGSYLLILLAEPHSEEDRQTILQRLTKGLLAWDVDSSHVDLNCELLNLTNSAPEGDEARNGEKLIQWASENLVVEVLIHSQVNTLQQCMKNLLASFTRHRHIIHAGYTFQGSGSWILQDGTFSLSDYMDLWSEPEVQRLLSAYKGDIKVSMHCTSEGGWTQDRLDKEHFSRLAHVTLNENLKNGQPEEVQQHSAGVTSFVDYLSTMLTASPVHQMLESSEIVGNIRFSRPTLYVFPGGQGDAALFGINGFNMLIDGGFARKACFWDFTRHLDRLDAVLLTRVNNNSVGGLGAVIQRKVLSQAYPQIGHFFGNVVERRHSKDEQENGGAGNGLRGDQLLISLQDEGQRIFENLRSINLKPHLCFRESVIEPINLYHKVGHGKLDLYILNPAKDSREVKEFLTRWYTEKGTPQGSKVTLRSSASDGKDFQFPVLNLVSICALLVWQPANPRESITRLLFPGSTPQYKIFEALQKLKHLEFLKFPVCSAKTIAASHKSKIKSEKILSEAKSQLARGTSESRAQNQSSHPPSTVHRAPSASAVPRSISSSRTAAPTPQSVSRDEVQSKEDLLLEQQKRRRRPQSHSRSRTNVATASEAPKQAASETKPPVPQPRTAVESNANRHSKTSSKPPAKTGPPAPRAPSATRASSTSRQQTPVSNKPPSPKKPAESKLKRPAMLPKSNIEAKKSTEPKPKKAVVASRIDTGKIDVKPVIEPRKRPTTAAANSNRISQKTVVETTSKKPASKPATKEVAKTAAKTVAAAGAIIAPIATKIPTPSAEDMEPQIISVRHDESESTKTNGINGTSNGATVSVEEEIVDRVVNEAEEIGVKAPQEEEEEQPQSLPSSSYPPLESGSELSSLDHISIEEEDEEEEEEEAMQTSQHSNVSTSRETEKGSTEHVVGQGHCSGGESEQEEEDEYLVVEKDEVTDNTTDSRQGKQGGLEEQDEDERAATPLVVTDPQELEHDIDGEETPEIRSPVKRSIAGVGDVEQDSLEDEPVRRDEIIDQEQQEVPTKLVEDQEEEVEVIRTEASEAAQLQRNVSELNVPEPEGRESSLEPQAFEVSKVDSTEEIALEKVDSVQHVPEEGAEVEIGDKGAEVAATQFAQVQEPSTEKVGERQVAAAQIKEGSTEEDFDDSPALTGAEAVAEQSDSEVEKMKPKDLQEPEGSKVTFESEITEPKPKVVEEDLLVDEVPISRTVSELRASEPAEVDIKMPMEPEVTSEPPISETLSAVQAAEKPVDAPSKLEPEESPKIEVSEAVAEPEVLKEAPEKDLTQSKEEMELQESQAPIVSAFERDELLQSIPETEMPDFEENKKAELEEPAGGADEVEVEQLETKEIASEPTETPREVKPEEAYQITSEQQISDTIAPSQEAPTSAEPEPIATPETTSVPEAEPEAVIQKVLIEESESKPLESTAETFKDTPSAAAVIQAPETKPLEPESSSKPTSKEETVAMDIREDVTENEQEPPQLSFDNIEPVSLEDQQIVEPDDDEVVTTETDVPLDQQSIISEAGTEPEEDKGAFMEFQNSRGSVSSLRDELQSARRDSFDFDPVTHKSTLVTEEPADSLSVEVNTTDQNFISESIASEKLDSAHKSAEQPEETCLKSTESDNAAFNPNISVPDSPKLTSSVPLDEGTEAQFTEQKELVPGQPQLSPLSQAPSAAEADLITAEPITAPAGDMLHVKRDIFDEQSEPIISDLPADEMSSELEAGTIAPGQEPDFIRARSIPKNEDEVLSAVAQEVPEPELKVIKSSESNVAAEETLENILPADEPELEAIVEERIPADQVPEVEHDFPNETSDKDSEAIQYLSDEDSNKVAAEVEGIITTAEVETWATAELESASRKSSQVPEVQAEEPKNLERFKIAGEEVQVPAETLVNLEAQILPNVEQSQAEQVHAPEVVETPPTLIPTEVVQVSQELEPTEVVEKTLEKLPLDSNKTEPDQDIMATAELAAEAAQTEKDMAAAVPSDDFKISEIISPSPPPSLESEKAESVHEQEIQQPSSASFEHETEKIPKATPPDTMFEETAAETALVSLEHVPDAEPAFTAQEEQEEPRSIDSIPNQVIPAEHVADEVAEEEKVSMEPESPQKYEKVVDSSTQQVTQQDDKVASPHDSQEFFTEPVSTHEVAQIAAAVEETLPRSIDTKLSQFGQEPEDKKETPVLQDDKSGAFATDADLITPVSQSITATSEQSGYTERDFQEISKMQEQERAEILTSDEVAADEPAEIVKATNQEEPTETFSLEAVEPEAPEVLASLKIEETFEAPSLPSGELESLKETIDFSSADAEESKAKKNQVAEATAEPEEEPKFKIPTTADPELEQLIQAARSESPIPEPEPLVSADAFLSDVVEPKIEPRRPSEESVTEAEVAQQAQVSSFPEPEPEVTAISEPKSKVTSISQPEPEATATSEPEAEETKTETIQDRRQSQDFQASEPQVLSTPPKRDSLTDFQVLSPPTSTLDQVSPGTLEASIDRLHGEIDRALDLAHTNIGQGLTEIEEIKSLEPEAQDKLEHVIEQAQTAVAEGLREVEEIKAMDTPTRRSLVSSPEPNEPETALQLKEEQLESALEAAKFEIHGGLTEVEEIKATSEALPEAQELNRLEQVLEEAQAAVSEGLEQVDQIKGLEAPTVLSLSPEPAEPEEPQLLATSELEPPKPEFSHLDKLEKILDQAKSAVDEGLEAVHEVSSIAPSGLSLTTQPQMVPAGVSPDMVAESSIFHDVKCQQETKEPIATTVIEGGSASDQEEETRERADRIKEFIATSDVMIAVKDGMEKLLLRDSEEQEEQKPQPAADLSNFPPTQLLEGQREETMIEPDSPNKDENKFIRPLPFEETLDSQEGIEHLLREARALATIKEYENRHDEKIPSAIPAKLPREARGVIRTPDEVADLPVHEEVDPTTYQTDDDVVINDVDSITCQEENDQLVPASASLLPEKVIEEPQVADSLMAAVADSAIQLDTPLPTTEAGVFPAIESIPSKPEAIEEPLEKPTPVEQLQSAEIFAKPQLPETDSSEINETEIITPHSIPQERAASEASNAQEQVQPQKSSPEVAETVTKPSEFNSLTEAKLEPEATEPTETKVAETEEAKIEVAETANEPSEPVSLAEAAVFAEPTEPEVSQVLLHQTPGPEPTTEQIPAEIVHQSEPRHFSPPQPLSLEPGMLNRLPEPVNPTTSVVITPSTPPVQQPDSTLGKSDFDYQVSPPSSSSPAIANLDDNNAEEKTGQKPEADFSGKSSPLTHDDIQVAQLAEQPTLEPSVTKDEETAVSPLDIPFSLPPKEPKESPLEPSPPAQGHKIFKLPGADDEEEDEEEDEEFSSEKSEPTERNGMGAICSGLLTAAATLSAPVISQSAENLATLPAGGEEEEETTTFNDKPQQELSPSSQPGTEAAEAIKQTSSPVATTSSSYSPNDTSKPEQPEPTTLQTATTPEQVAIVVPEPTPEALQPTKKLSDTTFATSADEEAKQNQAISPPQDKQEKTEESLEQTVTISPADEIHQLLAGHELTHELSTLEHSKASETEQVATFSSQSFSSSSTTRDVSQVIQSVHRQASSVIIKHEGGQAVAADAKMDIEEEPVLRMAADKPHFHHEIIMDESGEFTDDSQLSTVQLRDSLLEENSNVNQLIRHQHHHQEQVSSAAQDVENGNYSASTSGSSRSTVVVVTTSGSKGENGNFTTTTTTPTITTSEVKAEQATSGSTEGSTAAAETDDDILKSWGKPLGLPPAQIDPPPVAEGQHEPQQQQPQETPTTSKTPKKDKSVDRAQAGGSRSSASATPAKHHSSARSGRSHHRSTKHQSPVYLDLAYVPHHGNANYCDSEFFRLVRSRYYVFSGLEPSRQVFDGLLEGKQQWEDKNLEVTIIPTYDTDTLGYWMVDSEDALAEAHIDLAPSASRCTINLQDHETSCAAYRLEF